MLRRSAIKDGVTAWADDGSETGDSYTMRLGDHRRCHELLWFKRRQVG
jgi:hypothetical protein